MAEMIWNGAVTVYDFIMDNIVIINILFALIIVFFHRTGLSQEPYVQSEGD